MGQKTLLSLAGPLAWPKPWQPAPATMSCPPALTSVVGPSELLPAEPITTSSSASVPTIVSVSPAIDTVTAPVAAAGTARAVAAATTAIAIRFIGTPAPGRCPRRTPDSATVFPASRPAQDRFAPGAPV